jgi:hypothetical protein
MKLHCVAYTPWFPLILTFVIVTLPFDKEFKVRSYFSDLIWLQRRNCSAVRGSSTVPNGHVRETAFATISREPGNYYIGTQGM